MRVNPVQERVNDGRKNRPEDSQQGEYCGQDTILFCGGACSDCLRLHASPVASAEAAGIGRTAASLTARAEVEASPPDPRFRVEPQRALNLWRFGWFSVLAFRIP